MRLSVAAVAICLAVVGVSAAQTAGAAMNRKPTNIPAQPLGSALEALAKQRDLQVIYRSDLVASVQSAGAVGLFTSEEALGKLLAGTGLTYRYLNDTTVTIAPLSTGSSSSTPSANPPASGSPTATDDKSQKGGETVWDRFRLAQATSGQTQGDVSVEREAEHASNPKPFGLEEVVVTGTRLPSAEGEPAIPVRRYTGEDIRKSGQTTVAGFLNTLPDVSFAFDESGLFTNGNPGQTGVTLHGLPFGTTLVLLDGHRVEDSIAQFFDLSSVPAGAVDRVEILPVGSSAIYGADALGGAINIILRKNFNGLEASTQYGRAEGGAGETNASLGWGKSWQQVSVSLMGTYQNRGVLYGNQREPLSRTTFPADAPTFFYLTENCSPGNVYSLDGSNLPGLTSPQAGIPGGITGKPSIQDFAATAGKVNQCQSSAYFALSLPSVRQGVLASAHFFPSEAVDFYAELAYSHQQVTYPSFYSTFSGPLTLSQGNPFNPFGVPVAVSFIARFGEADPTSDFIRPQVGVRGRIGSDWRYDVGLVVSHDRYRYLGFGLGDSEFQQALNSTDPATALNPFDVNLAPGVVQALLKPSNFFGYDFSNQIRDEQAVLSGPLWHLPAGPLDAVFGAESSQASEVSVSGYTSRNVRLSRDTYAAFTEVRLPLFAARGGAPGTARLQLTAAGRYDHTNDFGGKATWQGGLRWHATQQLSVSGTYGISYKAPALNEITGGQSAPAPFNYSVGIDPLRGNQLLPPTLPGVSGANPNLQAETGNSHTLTVEYASSEPSGFGASLTYYDINITNYIATHDAQDLINHPELFPGAVVRGPLTPADQALGYTAGPITQIKSIFYNFGDLRVAGFDADTHISFTTPIGKMTPSLALSNIYKWQSALVPGFPLVGYVGQPNFIAPGWSPRWKGTASLAWQRGSLSANLNGRWLGPYKDYQDLVPNSNQLGNSWVYDFNMAYDAGKALSAVNRWLSGLSVSLGAVNLFDTMPPFSYGFFPYDPYEGDLRGRFVYGRIAIKY